MFNKAWFLVFTWLLRHVMPEVREFVRIIYTLAGIHGVNEDFNQVSIRIDHEQLNYDN